MGVHGLWKLIESSGKPIPIETLENKVLAVDVSIWLHQAVKGFQDYKGAPVANAHLLGIYHRVCKLLYFKIKPVFVFDGGVPALKRQTIAKRNQLKSRNTSEADKLQKQLLSTLLKHSAISKVLSETTKASLALPKKSSGKYDNLYDIPASSQIDSTLSSSDDEDIEETVTTSTSDSSPTKQWDLHTIDTTSIYFKSLPLDVKHEILTELKETRKQNSWGKLHQLPKQSDDFSIYQMKRLLKRQEVQSTLDKVSKEMGGTSLSLAELETLLNDQGVKTVTDNNVGKRIASDENTRYLYIKDLQQELKIAEEREQEQIIKKIDDNNDEEELQRAIQLSLEEPPTKSEEIKSKKKTKVDIEEEEELQKAIQLSLEEMPSTSVETSISKFSFSESFNDDDFQYDTDEDCFEETVIEKPALKKLFSAQSYMLEYSGLSRNEIDNIINKNTSKIKKVNSYKKNDKIKANNSVVEKLPTIIDNEINKAKLESIQVESKFNKAQLIKEVEKLPEKQNDATLKDDCSEVEIMSDSGESCNDEIDLKAKPELEIFIDPNKKIDDDDDLFSDIFSEKPIVFDNRQNITKDKTVIENVYKNSLETIIEIPNEGEDKSEVNLEKSTSSETIDEVNNSKEENQTSVYENVRHEINKNTGLNKDAIEPIMSIQEMDKLKENIQNDRIDLLKEQATKTDKNTEINKDAIEPIMPKMTRQEMEDLQENLQHERMDLLKEKATKERLANNITDQMYQEAQELLELFGVPYIIAPMEAEAQCAFLDEIELTNGTITDDSDIWLFGGKTVYKNFFNQSKYVMEFKSENIDHHFKLSREQMILLALLVGSDYTSGLQGVGPVTALEILASFPPSDSNEFKLSHNQLISGLKEFKSWFVKGKSPGPGRSTLKNKLKNVAFIDGFPNSQVVEAYLKPKVETSRDTFSWGKPDITGLTVFATEKFGWTMKKTEEILIPVIKKLEEHQTQKSIKDYFKTKFKINPVDLENKVSKRVKSAIDKIGKTSDELIAEEMAELEKEKERAIRKTKAGRTEKSQYARKKKKTDESKKLNNTEEKLVDDTTQKIGKRTKKKTDTIENKTRSKNKIATEETDSNLEKMEELVDDTTQKIGKRTKKKTDTIENKIVTESNLEKMEELVDDTTQIRKKTDIVGNKTRSKKKIATEETESNLEKIEDLKDYENLALELKTRRKKRNELIKIKIDEPVKKKPKIQPLPVENIPKELQEDEEIKLLEATTSFSNKLVDNIKNETLKKLEVKKNAPKLTNLHTKEVIHQKLRDKSNVLRNKLKAIEVYRRSIKGPGYVPKRAKKFLVPKEDADLSEDSD